MNGLMMQADTQTAADTSDRTDALAQQAFAERRSRTRYPLDLALSYRTHDRKGRSGTGRILNISSNGVLVECPDPFTAGTAVELSIEWPARLHGGIPLRLVVFGNIVRCWASGFAVAASRLRLRADRSSAAHNVPVGIREKQAEDPPISVASGQAAPVYNAIPAAGFPGGENILSP